MKRIAVFAVILALVLSFLPCSASADSMSDLAGTYYWIAGGNDKDSLRKAAEAGLRLNITDDGFGTIVLTHSTTIFQFDAVNSTVYSIGVEGKGAGLSYTYNDGVLTINSLDPLVFEKETFGRNSSSNIYPKTIDENLARFAEEAPSIIYSTTAEQNGLAGNLYYVEGTVSLFNTFYMDGDMNSDNIVNYFIMETDDGHVMVGDMYSNRVAYIENHPEEFAGIYDEVLAGFLEPGADYSFPPVGEKVRVYGLYDGFSNVIQMPVFYYGYQEWLHKSMVETP